MSYYRGNYSYGRGYYGGARPRNRGSNHSYDSSVQPGPSRLPSVSVESVPSANSIIDEPKCCQIFIDSTLNTNTITWLNTFKEMWQIWKRSKPVTNLLENFFQCSSNVYLDVFKLILNCPDCKDCKPNTLPFIIMEELEKWLRNLQYKDRQKISDELKHAVFNFITKQKNSKFSKMVTRIYCLSEDSQMFVGCIRYLIHVNCYKQACQMASFLDLQKVFTLEDLIIPLILQDKLIIVEEYLANDYEQQVALVKFLDSLLNRRMTIKGHLEPLINRLNIPEVNHSKLYPKPLGKLITRLVKEFNLSDDITPNLSQKRKEGAVQFLISKRFIHRSLGAESFSEMIKEAVGDSLNLQTELVHSIYVFDKREALQWATFYNIDKNFWPRELQEMELDPTFNNDSPPNPEDVNNSSECWDVQDNLSVPYLQLSLDQSKISLINSPYRFEYFLNTVLNDTTVIGIDSEWKPSFGPQSSELSLIQLATRNDVYILDVLALGNQVPELWNQFGVLFLNNQNILKVGFGLTNDIHMIRTSLKYLGNFQSDGPGFLDLLILWKELTKLKQFKFPYHSPSANDNLSTLTEICLGARLDKSDQFSNWENRPLRGSQLTYAALDAYCLIQIFDVISECAKNVGIQFDDLIDKIAVNTAKENKKKSKKSKFNNKVQFDPQPPKINLEPVLAKDVKFVCDSMVHGVGRALRRYGLDTVFINNGEDHMKCVEISSKDSRYIITRGTVFNKLYKYVPMSYCYRVKSDDVEEQIREILEYYNIKITKEDIFSRCQICNSGDFEKINQKKMIEIIESTKKYQENANTWLSDADQEEDYYEECRWDDGNGFYSEGEDDEPTVPTNRNWNLHEVTNRSAQVRTTRRGAVIQTDGVPQSLLTEKQWFYICDSCGKVYWDGSHYERVQNGTIHNILTD